MNALIIIFILNLLVVDSCKLFVIIFKKEIFKTTIETSIGIKVNSFSICCIKKQDFVIG